MTYTHEQAAGELTRYLLGELAHAEREAVARHLGACGACRAEAESLQGDLALVALASPLEQPPARARQRLLDAISRQPKLVPVLASRAEKSLFLRWFWAPAAAVLVLAIVAGMLWRDNRDLKLEARDLASIVAQTQMNYENTKELLTALTDHEAMHVTLVAQGSSPQPHGKATYVPQKGMLVFLASNMDKLPPHKAYQVWLVPVSGGKPVPAGRFKPDERGSAMVMQHSVPRVRARMVAVTVEPEEGATSPTMPMVLVSGAGGL